MLSERWRSLRRSVSQYTETAEEFSGWARGAYITGGLPNNPIFVIIPKEGASLRSGGRRNTSSLFPRTTLVSTPRTKEKCSLSVSTTRLVSVQTRFYALSSANKVVPAFSLTPNRLTFELKTCLEKSKPPQSPIRPPLPLSSPTSRTRT